MDVLLEFFRHNAMMNGRLLEACRRLPPDQLEGTATGIYGSMGATLVHIANAQVNHGTEHRSQVATILTQLGVEPPEMDGWTYFLASGHMVPII
jgi:uncharacterized damage-inducible protein DinB